MNIITKILLYYSLVLSLAFFVVGIVTSRDGNTIILNLLYLPIVLYLAYASINKKYSIIREKKDSAYLLVIFMFVILFLIGVFNVHSAQNLSKSIDNKSSSPIIIQNNEKNP